MPKSSWPTVHRRLTSKIVILLSRSPKESASLAVYWELLTSQWQHQRSKERISSHPGRERTAGIPKGAASRSRWRLFSMVETAQHCLPCPGWICQTGADCSRNGNTIRKTIFGSGQCCIWSTNPASAIECERFTVRWKKLFLSPKSHLGQRCISQGWARSFPHYGYLSNSWQFWWWTITSGLVNSIVFKALHSFPPQLSPSHSLGLSLSIYLSQSQIIHLWQAWQHRFAWIFRLSSLCEYEFFL